MPIAIEVPKHYTQEVSDAAGLTRLAKSVNRWENAAQWVRWVSFAWTLLTAATFGLLALQPKYSPSSPFLIAATAVTVACLIVLGLPMRGDVRWQLPRILMVLKWETAIGLTIAFTVAYLVRDEFKEIYRLFGIYLLIVGIPLAVLGYVSFQLDVRYGVRARYEARVKGSQPAPEG